MKLTNTAKYAIAAGLGAVLCFATGYGVSNMAKNSAVQTSKDGYQMQSSMVEGQKNGAEQKEKNYSRLIEKVDALSTEDKAALAKILGVTAADLENLDETKVASLLEKAASLDDEKKAELAQLIGMQAKDHAGNRGGRMLSNLEAMSDEDKAALAKILGVTTADLENLDETKVAALQEKIAALDEEKAAQVKELLKSNMNMESRDGSGKAGRMFKGVSSLSDEDKASLAKLLGVKTADLENLDADGMKALKEAYDSLDEEKQQAVKDLLGISGMKEAGQGMQGRGKGMKEAGEMGEGQEGTQKTKPSNNASEDTASGATTKA